MKQADLPPHIIDAFWKRWGDNSFLRAQGLELEITGVGEAVVRLPQPTPVQRGGGGAAAVLNGGVIAYMFDGALGCAIASGHLARPELAQIDPLKLRQSTINLDISYLEAATGASFEARGRVVRAGRSLVFAEGQLFDDAGRVCAAAKGIWRIFWPPAEPR